MKHGRLIAGLACWLACHSLHAHTLPAPVDNGTASASLLNTLAEDLLAAASVADAATSDAGTGLTNALEPPVAPDPADILQAGSGLVSAGSVPDAIRHLQLFSGSEGKALTFSIR